MNNRPTIEIIKSAEIEESLKNTTRQYLVGDLKLPQKLNFLMDKQVEAGISTYNEYIWEKPHYHTSTSEYCYILSGETKYIDLSNNTEYHFHEGDFYILRQGTPYIQKCKPGCKLLFFKVPGINDKVVMETSKKMLQWCTCWNNIWE